MKKQLLDLTLTAKEWLTDRHVLLKLTHEQPLPDAVPGQFAEVRIDGEPATLLRRPISICNIDSQRNELWLLVATIGNGTRRLGRLDIGDRLNLLLPLGKGFTIPTALSHPTPLLIGGGVGMAPMYFLGKTMSQQGLKPSFLLGARTASDILLADEFSKLGPVYVTTEDGTMGEKGFVTNHSILGREQFGYIATCGPKPMMVAVARYARLHGVGCEASLENMMACGLGACLCCVEKTTKGNLCVCKEGPVFNINDLLWQI